MAMSSLRGWVVACALGLVVVAGAQDAQFTQFHALPTYVSPAFAGTGAQTRGGLAYRDQWPSIPGSFVTANFALDHYLADLNSGMGLVVNHDRAGSGALRYTAITGQYAYEIELKRKVFLRPALQVGWAGHAVDYSRLVFGDQLARGGTVGTSESMEVRSVNYADVGAGALYFTPNYWLGISWHHLNRPNQTLLQNEARMPVRFSAHGGYRMRIRTPIIKEDPQSVVLAFNYRSQERYDQLDLGAYFERDPFFAGLWFRGIPLMKAPAGGGVGNNDAVALLVGFKVEDLRVGYSYDVTISRLAGSTGGAHELTLGYDIVQPYRKRSASRRRIVPCAKF
jgi:type IX secretion system PorP/SprF family membrane protein